jgi:hypothetical protein
MDGTFCFSRFPRSRLSLDRNEFVEIHSGGINALGEDVSLEHLARVLAWVEQILRKQNPTSGKNNKVSGLAFHIALLSLVG